MQLFDPQFIFLKAIEKKGVVIIPVAKIMYGLGGGSGNHLKKEGYGSGMGLFAKPIGYIEIKNNTSQFVPIKQAISFSSIMIGLGVYFLLKKLLSG